MKKFTSEITIFHSRALKYKPIVNLFVCPTNEILAMYLAREPLHSNPILGYPLPIDQQFKNIKKNIHK